MRPGGLETYIPSAPIGRDHGSHLADSGEKHEPAGDIDTAVGGQSKGAWPRPAD